MAQDADDAMSESSWTSLAKGKERYWWSVDLEGDMEKPDVEGLLSGTEGASVDPKRKMVHWSARIKTTKREKRSERPRRGLSSHHTLPSG